MHALSDADRRAFEANIWKSYVFQFLFAFQLWWPIWVIYLTDERRFSLTQVGVLEAIFWIVIVCAEVPTGAVADRWGRKPSLLAGAVCWAAAVLVFGLATSYSVVLLSYVVWGVGLTFVSGADAALMFESLKAVGREHEYPRVAGMGWGIAAAGSVLGMLTGAPLAALTNLAFPIVLSAAIGGVAFFVALTFREPELEQGEVRLDYHRLIGESARTAWRLPTVRSMLIAAAVLIASTNAALVFAQPFLEKHDVSVGLFGLAQTPMRVAGIFGAVAAYRISGLLGLRATMVGSALLLVASYVVLGGWNSVWAFGATTAGILIFNMLQPLVESYLNHRIPNQQRATILSFRQLLTSLTMAALLPGLGLLADRVSLESVFWASAAATAALAALGLAYWLRADAAEGETPAAVELETTAAG